MTNQDHTRAADHDNRLAVNVNELIAREQALRQHLHDTRILVRELAENCYTVGQQLAGDECTLKRSRLRHLLEFVEQSVALPREALQRGKP